MLTRTAVALLQTAEEVDEALAAVFARPEFEPPARSPLWELVARGLTAIGDFLRGLIGFIDLGEGGRTLVFWLVTGTIALAAILLISRLIRALTAGGSWRRGGGCAERTGVAAAPPPAGAEDWDRRAAALAAEGRWREAALALYQSLLHRLAAQGVLSLDPAKTPGDYRRESRRDPESQRLLERFLQGFEPVAFGGHPADAGAYARLREVAQRAIPLG